MADLSQLSDAEILALAGNRGVTPSSGLSDLSNEQIQAMAAQRGVAPSGNVTDRLGRALGLTDRSLIEGAAALPATILNIPAGGYNAAMDSIQGFGKGYRFPEMNTGLSDALTSAGLPQARSNSEKLITSGAKGAFGALTGAGLASAVGGPVAGLAANPGLQTVSGAASGVGSEGARQLGFGPGGQMAAGLLGALAPSAPAVAKQGLLSLADAGSDTAKTNAAAFANLGISPSASQVTGSPILQWADGALSKLPGGVGPYNRFAANQQAQFGNAVDNLASSLSPEATNMSAGRGIAKDLNQFAKDFSQKANVQYGKLDAKIPSDTMIPVNDTATAFDSINVPVPGARNISTALSNPRMNMLADAFMRDADNGMLPYGAVKGLRSNVGSKLGDFSLTSDLPRGDLKTLYGGLSSDMQEAALANGASNEFNRANNFYKAGQNRLETLDPIATAGAPEDVYSAALSGINRGPSRVNTVLKSVSPDTQKEVASNFLTNLSKANPGAQNAAGDVTSANTFLTNWNKVNPSARDAILGRFGSDFSDQVSDLGTVADTIRDGSKVLANPSGTASAAANIGALGGLGRSVLTGNVPLAGSITGAIGLNNYLARQLTSPAFAAQMVNPASYQFLAPITARGLLNYGGQ